MNIISKNLAIALSFALLAVGLSAQAKAAPAAQPAQAAPAQTAPAQQPAQVQYVQVQPAPAPVARPAPTPIGPIDGTLLSIELGMAAGYDLGNNDPVVGRTFGLNLMVADNLAVGFASTSAAALSFNLFRLGYAITPVIGMDIYVGNDGSTAGGLGAFVNLQRGKNESGVFSTLKLRLQYLTDTSLGLAKGDVIMAVSASVGI